MTKRIQEFFTTLWVRIVGVAAALRLVRDPNRLPDVFLLDRAVATPDVLDKILARISAHPRAKQALEERRRMAPLRLDVLAQLPEGTLGRAVADFMRSRGLEPDAIPRRDADDVASYVRAHLYETHDVWHVVTGFDTDVAGELAVQAFYSAQVDGALPRILLIGGLINARIEGGADWGRRLDAIASGWALGKSASPLFGVAWDDWWERPIVDVRRELQLAA